MSTLDPFIRGLEDALGVSRDEAEREVEDMERAGVLSRGPRLCRYCGWEAFEHQTNEGFDTPECVFREES